jgi:DNA-binding response OmpR family regulator
VNSDQDAFKILICDDEPALRELIRVGLIGNYVFEEAGTVAEAIAIADRFRPHLALVDLMMPTGSGLDIVTHIHREPNLQHARTVVVSAFFEETDVTMAERAGADAFVPKPFDPDELSETVRTLLATPH